MGFLGRYGWAIIIALAILWAPFMYRIALVAIPDAGGPEAPGPDASGPASPADPLAPTAAGPSADQEELLRLQREVDGLSTDLDRAFDRIEALERDPDRRGDAGPAAAEPEIPGAAIRYVSLVRPPERRTVNDTLDPSGHAWLAAFFGSPRTGRDYTQDCRPPDNPRLLANLELRDVGPFRVQMLKPALDSLTRIFARVKAEEPELYEILGSAGSLCGRLVRGSADRVSGHAYGAAVDITIAGSLDRMGDAETQLGLVLLHDYFREEGWYWGVAFKREDSMHFEVSRQTLEAWKAQGAFDTSHPIPEGDRTVATGQAQPEVLQ